MPVFYPPKKSLLVHQSSWFLFFLFPDNVYSQAEKHKNDRKNILQSFLSKEMLLRTIESGFLFLERKSKITKTE